MFVRTCSNHCRPPHKEFSRDPPHAALFSASVCWNIPRASVSQLLAAAQADLIAGRTALMAAI